MQAPPKSMNLQMLVGSRLQVAHVGELCQRSVELSRRAALLSNLARDAYYRLGALILSYETHSAHPV
jgi:hypothetical protein